MRSYFGNLKTDITRENEFFVCHTLLKWHKFYGLLQRPVQLTTFADNLPH